MQTTLLSNLVAFKIFINGRIVSILFFKVMAVSSNQQVERRNHIESIMLRDAMPYALALISFTLTCIIGFFNSI